MFETSQCIFTNLFANSDSKTFDRSDGTSFSASEENEASIFDIFKDKSDQLLLFFSMTTQGILFKFNYRCVQCITYELNTYLFTCWTRHFSLISFSTVNNVYTLSPSADVQLLANI